MKKSMCAASKTFSVKTLSALLFGTAGVFFAPAMLGLRRKRTLPYRP